MADRPVPSAEQLSVLAQVVRDVARASRLAAEDAEDFAQSIHVRLIERQYDIFHKFTGRSSLKTYLRVVVTRLVLDWRNSAYGKWRASHAARRLGPHAVLLERLLYRDGHTLDEAVAIVCGGAHAPSTSEARGLAEQLPPRRRRQRVGLDALHMHGIGFEDPVELSDRRAAVRRIRGALAASLNRLSAGDRRLVHLRYGKGQSVSVLARCLDVPAKPLYSHFDRVLRTLRTGLAAAGIPALPDEVRQRPIE